MSILAAWVQAGHTYVPLQMPLLVGTPPTPWLFGTQLVGHCPAATKDKEHTANGLSQTHAVLQSSFKGLLVQAVPQ